jgi:hypothetical protein
MKSGGDHLVRRGGGGGSSDGGSATQQPPVERKTMSEPVCGPTVDGLAGGLRPGELFFYFFLFRFLLIFFF